MIDKTWRAVTPLAIQNCFKKLGIRTSSLVDAHDTVMECNAEPFLWEAFTVQDLTFDFCAQVVTDIAVWGTPSDSEIVALDYNNLESDEDE
ncbi:hypothetical protein TNCT_595541 [Trichonephila clavata]|uniref:Uncharacterized protein n=1 Tax=Trichonephila clavata TaxID=2740835 RepID=A0A8X6J1T8_TRICU|nr:hypothetical protein TNCT_595541 [Trichonephila clavata]